MAEKEHGKSFRPKDDHELMSLLQRIGELERDIEGLESEVFQKAREYLAFKDRQYLSIAEREKMLFEMVAGLQAYADQNKDRLTKAAGKTTISMGDHQFGWRSHAASVVVSDEKSAIRELKENGYADCVEIIEKVDKNAVKDNITDFSLFKHLVFSTKEGFFIKPFGVLKRISKIGNILKRAAPKK